MQSQPTFNINLNFTVASVGEIPPLLTQIQEALRGMAAPAPTARTGPRQYPEVDPSASPTYHLVAEENLKALRSGKIPQQGWEKAKNLQAEIGRLGAAHRKVLLRAVANGGHITRDEVYEVTGRAPDKSLKGFTKPALGLEKKLQARGELVDGHVPLLEPIYETGTKTYQPAAGFKMPVQVVHLLQELIPQA